MKSISNGEEYRARLEKLKKDLEVQVKDLEEKVPEFGSDVDGASMDEETSETAALGANIGVASTLRDRLADVESALEKIDQDAYGICETCGKPIEKEILSVDPESRYCKACKLAKR